MADGRKGLRCDENRSEAGPSDRISGEEDLKIATDIQGCFDEFIFRLQPSITACCSTLSWIDAAQLTQIARRAIWRFAVDGNGTVSSPGLSAFDGALAEEIRSDFADDGTGHDISASPLRQFSADGETIANETVVAARALANKLVLKFRRLALSIAGQFTHTSVDKGDLQQESLLALRRAAFGFDPTAGSGFAAFARTVIRNHLVSVVRSSICPTEHYARRVEEFRYAEAKLMHQGNPRPSEDEVFNELDWSPKQRANLRSVLRLVRRGSDGTDVDMTQVPAEDDPPDQSILADDLVSLRRAVSRLSPEDQLLLTSRCAGMTFPAIAQQLHQKEHQVRLRHKDLFGLIALEMQQGIKTA